MCARVDRFIERIESGQVAPVPVGTVSIEHVGQDQDPVKMDWKKHL
jgi:hypothetical protein